MREGGIEGGRGPRSELSSNSPLPLINTNPCVLVLLATRHPLVAAEPAGGTTPFSDLNPAFKGAPAAGADDAPTASLVANLRSGFVVARPSGLLGARHGR
jgi:hypothetical protein